MLDFDLAMLYEVETRVLNQAIKRNLDSFPGDFMFKLEQTEWEMMSSQIVMTSSKRPKSALPYAFTEHGVIMLASVLKSQKARKMNIIIVRAFISLRQWALEHKDFFELLSDLRQRVGEHDIQLSQIYDTIENMLDQKVEEKKWEERERIGFRK